MALFDSAKILAKVTENWIPVAIAFAAGFTLGTFFSHKQTQSLQLKNINATNDESLKQLLSIQQYTQVSQFMEKLKTYTDLLMIPNAGIFLGMLKQYPSDWKKTLILFAISSGVLSTFHVYLKKFLKQNKSTIEDIELKMKQLKESIDKSSQNLTQSQQPKLENKQEVVSLEEDEQYEKTLDKVNEEQKQKEGEGQNLQSEEEEEEEEQKVQITTQEKQGNLTQSSTEKKQIEQSQQQLTEDEEYEEKLDSMKDQGKGEEQEEEEEGEEEEEETSQSKTQQSQVLQKTSTEPQKDQQVKTQSEKPAEQQKDKSLIQSQQSSQSEKLEESKQSLQSSQEQEKMKSSTITESSQYSIV